MWNATKFALLQLGKDYIPPQRDMMTSKPDTANFSTIGTSLFLST
jgi:hypothetical protein